MDQCRLVKVFMTSKRSNVYSKIKINFLYDPNGVE